MNELGGNSCSACGRQRASDARLFAARPGGTAALTICEHCVAECTMAIADAPTRIPGRANQCQFCGKPEGMVAVIVSIGAQKVCDECVDHYRALAR